MLRNLKTLSWSFLACVALVPIGCERFSSCEDTLCDDGPGGGGAGGGGSDLGGGGAGAGTGGVVVDPCDACSGETPLCNADDECVECLEATDCDAPSASKCTESGACIPCEANADCAHVGGTNVCDEGTCVECTVATEAEACGDNSCNPATKTCTETPRSSLRVCEACVADSECELGYACVPMRFNGTLRGGGYCLKAAPGCAGPYGVPTDERTSLSGAAPAEYCGINEFTTTCEAIVDLVAGTTCDSSDECGAAGLSDARCEIVNSGVGTTCTISCSDSSDCTGSKACDGPSDSKYCGG